MVWLKYKKCDFTHKFCKSCRTEYFNAAKVKTKVFFFYKIQNKIGNVNYNNFNSKGSYIFNGDLTMNLTN